MDPLEEFRSMAMAQCSLEDILFFLKISAKELDAIFQKEFKESLMEVYTSAKRKGLIQLKQAQYNAAINGDKTMLTLLGKEYLGQGQEVVPDEVEKIVVMLPQHKPIGAKQDSEESKENNDPVI